MLRFIDFMRRIDKYILDTVFVLIADVLHDNSVDFGHGGTIL